MVLRNVHIVQPVGGSSAWKWLNLTNIGVLASILIGLATLWLLNLQIREAEVQRLASYVPQLLVNPIAIDINVECKSNRSIGMVTRTGSAPESWDIRPYMEVVNVGKGAATEAQYLWNIGTKEHSQYLQEIGINWNSNDQTLDGIRTPLQHHDGLYNKRYVLPADQEKMSKILPSPNVVRQLEIQLQRLIQRHGCNRFQPKVELGGPRLSISYFDIGHRNFHIDFDVKYYATPHFQPLSRASVDGHIHMRYMAIFVDTRDQCRFFRTALIPRFECERPI